jgi:4'-phosphopantetheinyl transferase
MQQKSSFRLNRDEVQVWTLWSQHFRPAVDQISQVLAADELHRAQQFRFRHLYDSFVIVRGALRYLLGGYLNIHPSQIRFTYGPAGKPAIEAISDIQFNVTHSSNFAAIVVAAGCELGIDAEREHEVPEMQQIAKQFFCAEEAAEVLELAPSERIGAFFRCWTRKEAYLKAIGSGFGEPLDGFRVTVLPDSPARILHIRCDSSDAQKWTMHDLSLASGYIAALAYRDQPRSISILPVDALGLEPFRSSRETLPCS